MRLRLRRPDDMHVHFRAGDRVGLVAPFTARYFARALVMPNVPAVTTAALLVDYRNQIEAVTRGLDFRPLMTLKLHAGLTPSDIVEAGRAGAVAGKVYPDGVTTGSAGGVTLDDLGAMGPVFDAMQASGLVLCWHGEHPGPGVDYMDAEAEMLPVIRRVVNDFPRLRQVVEHVSTRRAVEWVEAAPDTVAATLTVHHLYLTHNDLVGRGDLGTGGRLNPHYFCWPMPKRVDDRAALVRAAVSGNPKFFLGTDSAPHAREDKECASGCAGVFSAPVALAALAGVFEASDALDAMGPFVSEFGARFYGLPPNEGSVTLERSPWTVPDAYCGGRFVPFLAGHELAWRVMP